MNYRSHDKHDIHRAILNGQPVYVLDTGSDGEDDVLIGNLADVTFDLCHHFEVSNLPDNWLLYPLS